MYKRIKSNYALNSVDAAINDDMANFELNIKGNTISFPDSFEFKSEDFFFYLKFIIANHQNLSNYNSLNGCHPL